MVHSNNIIDIIHLFKFVDLRDMMIAWFKVENKNATEMHVFFICTF